MKRVLVCVFATALVAAAQADTIYVDDENCPSPGSGTEADPFCLIFLGIFYAEDGDEVVVAPGTYSESVNFAGKAITLRSAEGPAVTIIGVTGRGVITCASGEGPDTVLSGFTISGGAGSDGGGMYNYLSSPTVTDCTFSGNSAVRGGGMFNWRSDPTVTGCTFSGNSAGEGGGLCNVQSSPTVTDCTFSENTATSTEYWEGGGGMFNDDGSSPTVTGCVFSNNLAENGGGMLNHDESNPTVTDCTFSDNTVTASLGGGGGVFNHYSRPTVTGCTFTGNSTGSHSLSGGGGMLIEHGSATVTSCAFGDNETGGDGGGMRSFAGGGITFVTNCTFTGNSAQGDGGGLSYSGFSVKVTNCTFVDNSAWTGGALLVGFGSNMTVFNCILRSNGPDAIGGAGSSSVSHSNVQGGWPGTGNIDADPFFVEPAGGNYRPAPGSPCIDAGDNTPVPDELTTDLDGNPRFYDDPDAPDCPHAPGTCGDPPVVDMGAYEFSCRCDCQAVPDGAVNVPDFLALLEQWHAPGRCDFDGGEVHVTDFLILLANWGPCP